MLPFCNDGEEEDDNEDGSTSAWQWRDFLDGAGRQGRRADLDLDFELQIFVKPELHGAGAPALDGG